MNNLARNPLDFEFIRNTPGLLLPDFFTPGFLIYTKRIKDRLNLAAGSTKNELHNENLLLSININNASKE